MRRYSCFIYSALIVFAIQSRALLSAEEPLNIEETRKVLNSYYRVHGGNARLGALISVRFTGSITFGETEKRYPFRLFKKRPNLVRYELEIDERKTWILSGKKDDFRSQSRTGSKLSEVTVIDDQAQLQMLNHETAFDGLLWNLRQMGRQVKIYPEYRRERLSSYRCEVSTIGSAFNGGSRQLGTVWLNASSFYAEKRELPSEDGETITSIFSDYRIEGTYPFAFKVENVVGESLASKTLIDGIEVNPGALDMFFELR